MLVLKFRHIFRYIDMTSRSGAASRKRSLPILNRFFTPSTLPSDRDAAQRSNALALGLILAMYNEQLSDHSNRRIGARLRPADKEEGATLTKIIFSIVGALLTACLA